MEAFGGFVMDEQAIQVENVFLEFLKRFVFFSRFSPPNFEFCFGSNSVVNQSLIWSQQIASVFD